MTALKSIGLVVAGVIVGLLFSVAKGDNNLGGVYNQVSNHFISGLYGGDTNQFRVDADGNITTTGTLTGTRDVTTPVSAATTITASQSGSTFVIGTTGAVYTLPAVTNDGFTAKFVVGSAFTTDAQIKTAEGDNLSGTLIVAGAVVDCRDEDYVNFIADGEAIGDTVEVFSDGTQWLIRDSNVLTTAKATCTDPS